MKILDKISVWYQQNKPFVAYKKPNENVISSFFQQTNELFYTEKFTETGFVFAPFDDEKQAILIPNDKSDFLQEQIDFKEVVNNENSLVINKKSEEFHRKIVDKAIANIVDNEFRKVVLSRKEEVELSEFTITKTLKRMITAYPTAMVYVWCHPKVGLWLGATPETLVKISDDSFETMSLAGTQVYKENSSIVWQEKEIDEQQMVTDYIVEKLESICKEISTDKVETVKAGNLLHLKTKITGKLKNHYSELIKQLHPTPAVCGFPKESAKNFILEVENYDREFYTGFLGELNVLNSTKSAQNTKLYVNLRCMQIKNGKAILYIGGGITKDSDSRKEWQETEAKAQIMKRILL